MVKKNALRALLVFFIHQSISAQSGWFWLNPLPQGNYLNSVSYVNSSVVYVSGAGGTLMKSTNGGVDFSMIQTGLRDNLGIHFINEQTGFSSTGSGFLRTTTAGTSWQYFPIPTDHGITGFQYTSNNSLFILVRKYIGNFPSTLIYKCTDLGETWDVSLTPTPNTVVNSFHFADQNNGYAVGRKWGFIYSKIYKTTNGGISWDSIASNLRTELISVNFTSPNTGYTIAGTYLNKILKTTNGCISWDTVYNFSDPPAISPIKFFNEMSGYAGNSGEILMTTNGGSDWKKIPVLYRIELFNINDGLGIAPYGYNFIYKTTNTGLDWQQITQGFGWDLWGVWFINENTGFTAAYDRIYKTTNSGLNWNEYRLNIQGWPPYVENIMFVNDNTGYAGIDGGKIVKTTNCGESWKVYETGCGDHNHGLFFPSVDTGYAVTKYGYYLKTTNGGVNWINFGQVGSQGLEDVHFINNNTGFAGGGIFSQSAFVTKTTNGGLNWSITVFDSAHWINDVCAYDDNNWFAAGYGDYNNSNYRGYIFRSTNAGLTWTSTNLNGIITALHFYSNQIGFAVTGGTGMYKTTNGGNSWFPINCISANWLYDIFFVSDSTGYAVGANGNIIKTTTGGGDPIGIKPVKNEIPQGFKLYQNYPNPFNPATKIKFEIPYSKFENVEMKIYDIIGREIATLVNEQLQPGVYEVEWDGTNFASGVYFYMLKAGSYTITKKMVLMK